MTFALLVIGGVAGIWFCLQGFGTKLVCYLALLPFVTWLQIHVPFHGWPLVPSAMLALTAITATGLRPPAEAPFRIRALGTSSIVLLYAAVAIAEVFNPGIPSVTLGIRGVRLIVEPLLLYFVGAEVARRPQLLKRAITVVLITGVVVVAYAFKQALQGFDAKEIAYYHATFKISLAESRIASTMAGASVFGNYVVLVGVLAVARAFHRTRPLVGGLLGFGCAVCALLTGQRGVMISGAVALAAFVALGLRRPSTHTGAMMAGAALLALLAGFVLLVATTPLQDRRLAGSADLGAHSAFQSARIKIGLLKSADKEASLQLRVSRLAQLRDAVELRPLGAGAGLNLLVAPTRSRSGTVLGTLGYGSPDFQPALQPIPGELYYYTLASELGVAGLALFVALGLVGLRSAARVALRSPDGSQAVVALATFGFLLFVLLDGFDVDAMSSNQVASFYWLLLGVVCRWERGLDRVDRPRGAGDVGHDIVPDPGDADGSRAPLENEGDPVGSLGPT